MRIVAGAFGGRVLKTVDGPGYRPAMSRVREALFSMLESRGVVWSGSRVLDLFAGSGSLAFEAASRGAALIQMVENSSRAVHCLRANTDLLGLDNSRAQIIQEEVGRVVGRRCTQPFDVVFVDPPYGKNMLPATIRAIVRQGWLCEGGILSAEIEGAVAFDALAYPLEFLTERFFGQTRIILWTTQTNA